MSPSPPGDGLTVMTLNLWGTNRWAERRDAVVALVREHEPDCLALQEVVRTPAGGQAEWLAERTGMQAAFSAASQQDDREFGNAVLSRLPVAATRTLALTDAGAGGERRGAVTIDVESRRGLVSVTSVHLSHLFDEGWVREAQVLELADFVRRPAGDFPPVVAGDLNARPDSAEVRFLKGLTSLEGRSFHLFDAWEVAHPDQAGSTWSNANPYAAPNRVPDQRIDYVLVGVRDGDGAGVVVDAEVVGAGSWPSDHLAVVARLACPAR